MLDIAIEIVFMGAMSLFWNSAQKATLRVFRIVFMLAGFLCLYAAFTTGATFSTAYLGTEFTVATINSLTNVLYTFAYVAIALGIFYLMIELAIYLYEVFKLLGRHNTTKDAFLLVDKQGE